jgi:hypothetical protein
MQIIFVLLHLMNETHRHMQLQSPDVKGTLGQITAHSRPVRYKSGINGTEHPDSTSLQRGRPTMIGPLLSNS